jgi:hypothetical protein
MYTSKSVSHVFNGLPGDLCLLWYNLLWVSCLLIPEIKFMPVMRMFVMG